MIEYFYGTNYKIESVSQNFFVVNFEDPYGKPQFFFMSWGCAQRVSSYWNTKPSQEDFDKYMIGVLDGIQYSKNWLACPDTFVWTEE